MADVLVPGLVVVKIGGSLITDRSQYKTPDLHGLRRLVLEVARAPGPVVVVHGAGSYGHVLAEKHRLAEGSEPRTRERLEAFARVHADVRELDRLVVQELRVAGLAPVAVSPLEVAHLSGGALDRLDLAPFTQSLALGLTPVTFGDAVHDDVRGWGIVSGDLLAARLALGVGAPRLVHATDVDGVLDRPPGEPGAKVLGTLTPNEAEALATSGAGKAEGRADVTGGMASKLRSSALAARRGTDVLILHGGVPGRLGDALEGKDVPGTTIRGTTAVTLDEDEA